VRSACIRTTMNKLPATHYCLMAISQMATRSSCLVSVYLASAADSLPSSDCFSDPPSSTVELTLHSCRK
jgi:hypothetical protein